MTTLIIKSDSAEKTKKLIQFAKELGLLTNSSNFKELNVSSMVNGIGRKATDEELINYLFLDIQSEPVNIDTAFLKYSDK